ncbi:DUF4082 domain-containing protein [Umezawaea endophytica]|uniref:DUF4082 domain-containing protein n=1 Tax=Umezawaea endophytica TaxID=1654476 RepID=A0A9X2VTK4_9PSEU|nr:DUF4082 domain-containing protein [Umezawaea endophytica]MCS7481957.1 DUF4082 domain-containing protein [Umezawaea endophytica]
MSWLPRLVAVVAALGLVLSGTAYAADNPMSVVSTPTTGAGVEVGVPLLITGIAHNGEAGGIVSVELSVDGGDTWFEVGTTESWRYTYTPPEAGDVTIVSRASTASTTGAWTSPITVHVGGAATPLPVLCSCYFQLPDGVVVNDQDAEAVELGMRTRFDRNGSVTGIAFRRGTYPGPVTARVWSGAGDLLAEKVATGTRILFDAPVPVTAGADYVVSYYTPAGGYASTEDFFTGTVVSTPFSAPHNGVSGAGVYHYGDGGGFPTDTWHDSNYWVAPYFQ